MEVSAGTRVCAVIGNPVAHSLSPALHNAAFREKGLDICYVAFRVEDLEAAVRGVRGLGLLGLSVTIPHKVRILQHLDEVDETARRIGSVNTVLNRDGRLLGSNSDGMGAVRALREAGVELDGRNVLLLGSGGAARAIAFTLLRETPVASLTLLGVDHDECGALARELQAAASVPVTWHPLEPQTLAEHVPASDGIIHCTPVGMHPRHDESLLDRETLRGAPFVFDIVYTPLRTRLLREAEAAGCCTVQGVEMFVHQAVCQFELWTGEDAPVETMRRVVMEALA